MDFGCGCGRTLRCFQRYFPEAKLYGADIDEEAIEWCRGALPALEFAVNDMVPPMVFPDGCFDFIIGISVFTHLPEDLQYQWLAELQRVSQKGALLILSVHGQDLGKKILEPKLFEDFKEKGFFYKIGTTGVLKKDGLPDYYQGTFHTRDYIDNHWGTYFEVVDYVSKGITNHQDAVILRAR